MKKELRNIYENTTKNIINEPNKVSITFIRGAKVEIVGDNNKKYYVQFIDNDNGEIIHNGYIKNNQWIQASREWFTNWKILIFNNDIDGEIEIEYEFNLENKKVYISFESSSLGDSLAWIPYVEEFRKKHKCNLIVSTFNNILYENEYPGIIFIRPGVEVTGIHAQYGVGIFDDGYSNLNLNKVDIRTHSLQQVATEILGLDYTEIKPDITIPFHSVVMEYYLKIKDSTDVKYYQTTNGRFDNFSYLMTLLSHKDKKINILETGCSRAIDNNALYDGAFTLLFSDFIKQNKHGGNLITIDNDKSNLESCKILTKSNKNNIDYIFGDSIKTLKNMSNKKINNIDLFYLDSYDLDLNDDTKSAKHHLREVEAIIDRINDDVIIVVDDNWNSGTVMNGQIIEKDTGKGTYIKQFLLERNWKLINDTSGSHVQQFIFKKEKPKYVCIAEHSTAKCKYWNNETGWQDTVNYLNDIGYKVIIVSKEKSELKNVFQYDNANDLQNTIQILKNSDMFIGVSSGLAWLSWAVGIPVIMISGFTKSWNEFKCNRIINENVCNGCHHDYTFDRGDWNWCPTNKDFECTKEIKSETVINEIKIILNKKIEHANITEQRKWGTKEIWKDDGHEWSSNFGSTLNLWNTYIHPIVKKYLYGNVLEIAPGMGRITEYLLKYTDVLDIVDLNSLCIDTCKEKFKNNNNINFYVNDGLNLNMLNDGKYNFIFSWDSFVHMHRDIIDSYLSEIYKKLIPGGISIIHHANIKNGNEESFKNIAGRSNINKFMFFELLEKHGFEVISQEKFNNGTDPYANNVEIIDVITTFKKPESNVYKFHTTDNEYSNLQIESIGFEWHNSKFKSHHGMFNEIFNDKDYEFDKCKIEKDDIVVDIGANIGVFERYAQLKGARWIYCFEPEDENYKCLLKNKNNSTTLSYNCIVSDIDGEASLYLDETSGGHSIINNNINDTKIDKTIIKKSKTLNTIIKEECLEKIDFLKIDAEGAELKIINGISDVNLNKINKISLEWHDMIFDFDESIKEKFAERLRNIGFNSHIHIVSSHLTLMYFWK